MDSTQETVKENTERGGAQLTDMSPQELDAMKQIRKLGKSG